MTNHRETPPNKTLSARASTKELGHHGETIAEAWLADRGYTPIERNWRAGALGEVDLIMSAPTHGTDSAPILVFIEVKTRRNRCIETALELALAAVDANKQQQLYAMAEQYLAQHPDYLQKNWACRMDVVAMGVSPRGSEPPRIHHIPDAI